jgi:hypothetical protein
MDKHYYLIAQLPMLSFDREMPVSVEEFLRTSRRWLSRRELRWLALANLKRYEPEQRGPRVWQDYQQFEYRFRTDLAAWRESRRSDQEYKPTGFPVALVREGNPLEIEKKLLRHRWITLDAMEKEHHFDLGFLIIYYLKLQILQRLTLFRKEEGREVLQQIVYGSSLTERGAGVLSQEEAGEISESGEPG